MARNVLLLAVALAAIGLALWGFGVVGPGAGDVGDLGAGEGAAPDLVDGPDGAAAPTPVAAPGAAGLASGAPRVVARSKPPTVDGPRITGRVTDGAGNGIREAHVLSVPDTATKPFLATDVGTDACPAFDAVTDAEGRFAVAVAADAPYHALVVEAAGFGPVVRSGVAAYADVTVVLEAGAALIGTVSDADGRAIVGATVRLFTMLDLYRRDLETVTVAGGAYRLDGLPTLPAAPRPGGGSLNVALEAKAEGYAPVFLGLNPYEWQPGKEQRRDLILVRGASVRGRVLDAESQRPIAGARVVLWSSEGMSFGGVARPSNPAGYVQAPWASRLLGETTSDPEGRYAFENVPSQGFHHGTSASMYGRRGPVMGYVAAVPPGYVPRAEDVPMARNGAAWEIDLKVRLGAYVSGRVVGKDGKPVAKAVVSTEVKGMEGSAWLPAELFRDVATSANWDGLGPDGRYRLIVPTDTTRALDAKVTGHFPMAGGMRWRQEGDGSVTVSVTAGASVDAPDLVLDGAADVGTGLTLLVRTEDGRPFFGALATWNATGMPARSDATGRVTLSLPVMPAGQRVEIPPESQLTVSATGYATVRRPVPASAVGGDAIEVTLKPGRLLTGRVVRSDGLPAGKARVSVGDGSRPPGEVFPSPVAGRTRPPALPGAQAMPYGGVSADKEGRFVVEDLPDGPYHVAAWPAVNVPVAPGVSLMGLLSDVPTGAADVEVRLPPAASAATGGIEGRVVDASTKRPVPGLVVSLAMPSESPGAFPAPGVPGFVPGIGGRRGGARGNVTSPGVFEMADVVAGVWSLSVSAEGYRPVTIDNVVVRDGQVTAVGPVELDRGVRVRGRLRPPEGATMKDRNATFAAVASATSKARSIAVYLEADGSFDATGFTPGTWRVSAYKQGYSERQEPVLVAPTGASLVIREGEIDVTFDAGLVVSGQMSISPTDERLPPPPWRGGGTTTEAQTRFGEAARLVVKDADGFVVGEQKGLFQENAFGLAWLTLAPGRYVVRYEAPGDEAREETFAVKPGETTPIVVSSKGIASGSTGGSKGGIVPIPAR